MAWATAGMRTDGVALAAVGSLGGRPGPLSDVDLVLLQRAGLSESAINALADRSGPIWDAGVKLSTTVSAPSPSCLVAQADLDGDHGVLDHPGSPATANW